MGMYTGLRARVRIKPEWREAMAYFHSAEMEKKRDEAMTSEVKWIVLGEMWPKMPGVADFGHFSRCGFIPHGVMCLAADGFGTGQPVPAGCIGFTHPVVNADDGHEDRNQSYSWYDPATGVWEFACSLKNYERTIQFFVFNVLEHISEAADWCEDLYETNVGDPDEASDSWKKYTTKYLTELPKIGV